MQPGKRRRPVVDVRRQRSPSPSLPENYVPTITAEDLHAELALIDQKEIANDYSDQDGAAPENIQETIEDGPDCMEAE